MQNRLVVFTVAMGTQYSLPQIADAADADFVCFTDQEGLESDEWGVKIVPPIFPGDAHRSSREQKLRPHRYLANYKRSIYVDSRVDLLEDPEAFWQYLIPNDDTLFGAFHHSFRDTVVDEFLAVSKAKLEHQSRLDEHQEAMALHFPDVLNAKPVWGGVLARRHNAIDCMAAMEVWFANVLRYSRRDQLSLPLALEVFSEEQKNIIASDIKNSAFHRWRSAPKIRPANYTVQDAMGASEPGAIVRENSLFEGQLSAAISRMKGVFGADRRGAVDIPKGTQKIDYGYDEERDLFFAKDKTDSELVYVSDRKRLSLYAKGTAHRQSWLVSDYRLPPDLVDPGDVVIDVGANIGELGRWVESNQGFYVAFEPDPHAHRALGSNVASNHIFDVALSDENGTAEFYLSTSTADSSLFKPANTDAVVSVRKATLDSFLVEKRVVGPIRLLKVEAEGMEPEVLAGAVETLKRTEFVAVDAGPERGGENTVSEVFRALIAADFEVIDCYLLRGTFLFQKSTKT